MRPPRLMWRVMARRAASIWRAVKPSAAVAFQAVFTEAHLVAAVALPVLRPFCSLRYYVWLACSTSCLLSSGCLAGMRGGAAGPRLGRRRHGVLTICEGSFFGDDLALEHPTLMPMTP
jgi:hypothetical protein